MQNKKKYIKLTVEAYEAEIARVTYNAHREGKIEGAKEEAARLQSMRIESVYKLINSIGQTQAQFASMLHEDGVISKLIR